MARKDFDLFPLSERGPLRILFVITSMPVGGAETLLVNLVRGMDRRRFLPEICCLKQLGPLGEMVKHNIPVHALEIRGKWDLRVWSRLRHLMRSLQTDAVITVGAGDKMFWGRLAARRERVPVICSAIHSTGWPDQIGFLNRQLTSITDAFIAVASGHGQFLVQREGFPPDKVRVIPNGIDTARFCPSEQHRLEIRRELGIAPGAPFIGVVAALRPEKNHRLFLHAAARVKAIHHAAQFAIIGDGVERVALEHEAARLGLFPNIHFLGTRSDIPRLLTALDVFSLTSHTEANPVSILEALSCGVPVVATRVGSVPETVICGHTGYLVTPGNVEEVTARWVELLGDSGLRQRMGQTGRSLVESHWSLTSMIQGYERLITDIYQRKCPMKTPTPPEVGYLEAANRG